VRLSLVPRKTLRELELGGEGFKSKAGRTRE
jgi:hypothetical protein